MAAGEIPASVIPGLLTLTKMHPGLADVAVTLVLDRADVYDAEPWTWREVADDPLRVVAGGLHDETVDAPAGVFVSTSSYPLSAFTLDDKGAAAAAKFAELRGTDVDALQISFDHTMVEQARKLNAAHTPDHGWVTLIVGQDVADTLAADTVTAALKQARTEDKRARDAARTAAAAPAQAPLPTTPAPPAVARRPARSNSVRRPGRSVPRPPRTVSSARCSTSSSAWRSSTPCRG